MRPIKLKLKGINSFVSEQEVDFERLTETGIFGIVGDTGSGKSTIIDAMILALYGEVPRYNKKTDRDFINSFLDEAFVSFEFDVNVNGDKERYKVERSFKKDKDGKIKEKISRFIKTTNEEEILSSKNRELTSEISELLGLKYEDFTRAVILPQGKFSEFLTLENQDRRKMLERIFKLEKYGDKLNNKVKDSFKIVENEMKILDANLEANVDITDEALKELKAKKEVVSIQLEKNSEKELNTSKLINGQKENISLVEELEEKSKFKISLDAKKTDIEEKKLILSKSKKAENLIDYINKIEVLEKDLNKLFDKKQLIEKQYVENQKQEENAKEVYDKIVIFKNENYETLIEKINNAKKAIDEEEQLEIKKKALIKAREAYKTENDSLKNEKVSLEKLQNKAKDLVESTEKKKLMKEKNKVTQNLRNTILNGMEVENNLSKNYSEKLKLEKEIADNNQNIKENKEKLNIKIEEEKELSRKYEKFNVDAKVLNKLKESLKIGDICPICGEKIKETLEIDKESEEKIDEKDLAKLKEEILSLNVAITTNENNINKNKAQLILIKEEKDTLEKTLKELKEKDKIDNYQAKHIEMEKQEQENEILEKEINIDEIELKKINAELEMLKESLTVKDKKLESIKVEGQTLNANVIELTERLEKLVGSEKPKILHKTLEKDKNNILETEKKEKENLDKIVNEGQALKSSKEGVEGEILSITKINDSNKNDLDKKMKEMNFSKTSEIKDSYKGKEKQTLLEDEIEKFNNNLLLVTTQIAEIEGKIKDIDVKKLRESYEENTLILSKLEEEKNNFNKELGSINSEVARIENKIQEVKTWTKRKKELTKELDNLTILKKLFAGNAFIEFIGKRHLKYICAEGTKRLKIMSNDKYEIQLKDSDFVIKDNSRGGGIRSPKTLSGGEVFMVSLCLSLALSNQIQMKNSGSLDMFFLDEGFGTLDNNSRDTVINSLLGLVDDNKMKIGLITHVEEIKEMLPSKLVVNIDDPEEGSRAIIKR